jgi:hypothetical protein
MGRAEDVPMRHSRCAVPVVQPVWLHESGTYVKFTQAGADLFA